MSYSRTPVDVAQLNALLDLINSSVQEIISTYNTEGHDVLALDSTELGPFDSPENTPLRLTNTIQIVEAACAQLCATVAPPGHTMINVNQLSHLLLISLTLKSILESPKCTHLGQFSSDCATHSSLSSMNLHACELRPAPRFQITFWEGPREFISANLQVSLVLSLGSLAELCGFWQQSMFIAKVCFTCSTSHSVDLHLYSSSARCICE